MKYQYSYLITIQFLGFRFHGWQKQPQQKTVHEVVDKTLGFVFGHSNFKSIGTGRTDAKVSSSCYYLQLFSNEKLSSKDFLEKFNSNGPADLKALDIRHIENNSFNIIQSAKIKEYHYYFSNQGRNHPYAAPFLVAFEGLNIELMKKGAKYFEGNHFFGNYCTKPSENSQLNRSILISEITENSYLSASFFPDESFVYRVRGTGFLRYQIRLMMGALIRLGKGKLSLEQLEQSLVITKELKPQSYIAPASGLHLYTIELEK